MNKKIWTAIGASALLATTALPALAAHEAGVSATVTPQLIAVSVDTPSVDYGFKDFSTSDVSRTTALSGTIIATNDGNVNQDLALKGSNSDNWTLDFNPADTGTVAINQFVHRFDADADFTSGTAVALDTSGKTLAIDLPSLDGATDDAQFELQMNMPLSTSTIGTQTTTVTVIATAN